MKIGDSLILIKIPEYKDYYYSINTPETHDVFNENMFEINQPYPVIMMRLEPNQQNSFKTTFIETIEIKVKGFTIRILKDQIDKYFMSQREFNLSKLLNN